MLLKGALQGLQEEFALDRPSLTVAQMDEEIFQSECSGFLCCDAVL